MEDAGGPKLHASLRGKLAEAILKRLGILKRTSDRTAKRAAEEDAKPKPTPTPPKPAQTPKPPAKPSTPKPRDVLNPNGKPIGKLGNRQEVRIEKGGDKAAKELYDKLKQGGKPDTPKDTREKVLVCQTVTG